MAVRFSFALAGGNAEDVPFEVVHFEGTEELSTLYRFAIQLASKDPGVDLGDLIGTTATLTIDRDENVVAGAGPRHFHGLISEAAVLGASHGSEQQFFYEVVLVPRVWLLTRSRGYRVFGTDKPKEVFKVVEAVLKDEDAIQLTEKEDFEFRNLMEDAYGKRDYYAQFDESHLDFAARIMEHVGMFYFFEQGDSAEKMIVGDGNVAFQDIHGGDTQINYRADVMKSAGSPQSIQVFVGRRHQLPEKIVLHDYEYDLNDPNLVGERAIEPAGGPLSGGANNAAGVGEYFGDFGKPYAVSPDKVQPPSDSGAKAKDRMTRLLGVRAEEIVARQIEFTGRSDREDLYPGGQFQLRHHFRDEMNAKYLVTEVRHEGTTPTYGASGLPGAADAEAGYWNDFKAIHSEVQFRPERRTPKPRFLGMMPAIVDTKSGVEDDERAQIDAIGRYKIRLPFDSKLEDREDGQASSYFRMSSLSAGSKQGMHFPLLPGAEVIWSCINGDIDRPIICGAMPNRAAPSNVTWENRTQSRIDTPGGIQIVMNDGPGKKKE